jgi:hypothetical protein|tara:strand:- start:1780 stop:2040 length:261 start_codon:yes stop_codon:yes gene_type:complete
MSTTLSLSLLFLYYLKIPYLSHVSQPILLFICVINLFDELMSREPDVIFCSDTLYQFCDEIDNYEKIKFDAFKPEPYLFLYKINKL